MTGPQRIQRRRTAGWRMPEGAVYVGRPSRWGNPFTVMNGHRQGWLVWDDRDRMGLAPGYTTSGGFVAAFATREEALADAVKRYRKWIRGSAARCADLVPELAGRDLACWCPLDQPCHADVLLQVANDLEGGRTQQPPSVPAVSVPVASPTATAPVPLAPRYPSGPHPCRAEESDR